MSNQQPHSYKIIIIGDSNVGKTSLLRRYLTRKKIDKMHSTLACDFHLKEYKFSHQNVQIQYWDTAGQERFASLCSPFYRGAHGCMIVFDISDHKVFFLNFYGIYKTFDSIDKWYVEFKIMNHMESADLFPFMIVGNKLDLEDKREVQKENVQQWCKSKGNVNYFEVSSENLTLVDKLFNGMAERVFNYVQEFESLQNLNQPQVEHVNDNQNEDQKQNQEDKNNQNNPPNEVNNNISLNNTLISQTDQKSSVCAC